jgi:hypothetical protein
MLEFLAGTGSPRKLRLFACACCRSIWPLLDAPSRAAVEMSERYADGLADLAELHQSAEAACGPARLTAQVKLDATTLVACAAEVVAAGADLAVPGELLRDLFGNPFRPVSVDRSWQGGVIGQLARSAYEEGFEVMPVLADALEEAGCGDPDILSHCRQSGTHVRGCWAVDALLGDALFAETFPASAETFLERAGLLLGLYPALRLQLLRTTREELDEWGYTWVTVTVTSVAEDIRALAGSPSWQRLEALDLSACEGVDGAALRALAALPHLPPLVLTWAQLAQVRAAGLHARILLARQPEVTALTFADGTSADAGVQVAGVSPRLARLTKLDLCGAPLGEAGARALAEAPFLSGLRELNLQDAQVGAAGAQALADSATLASLTTLSLRNNHLGPEGARALADSPLLGRLRTLNLVDNHIVDAGAVALAGSAHLAGLGVLNLAGNDIGDAGAVALAASPHLAGLTELNLACNRIGNTGALALAGSPHLAGLHELGFRFNSAASAGEAALRSRFGGRVKL